jgi:hypothetical protein
MLSSCAFKFNLRRYTPVWHNPFGILPKLGLVFPVGAGMGMTMNLVGIPVTVPTYFEIEAGFVGCASKIYDRSAVATAAAADEVDDDDDGDNTTLTVDDTSAAAATAAAADDDATLTAQAALGRQRADHSSHVVPFGPQQDVNGNAITAASLGEGGGGSSSIPGLENIYCGRDNDGDLDPYGEEPTVFKIAIVANIEAMQTGVLIVMRKIYPVRIVLMLFPYIPKAMKKALIGMVLHSSTSQPNWSRF